MKEVKFLTEIRGILEQGRTNPERDEFLGVRPFLFPSGTVFVPMSPSARVLNEMAQGRLYFELDPGDPGNEPINVALSQVEEALDHFIKQKKARLSFETCDRLRRLKEEIDKFGRAVGEIELLPSEWKVLEQFLNVSENPGFRWDALHPKPPKEVRDLRFPFIWMQIIGGAAEQAAEEFESTRGPGPPPLPTKLLGTSPEHDLVFLAWIITYRFHGPPSIKDDGRFLKILANIVKMVLRLPEVGGPEDLRTIRVQMAEDPSGLARNSTVREVHRNFKRTMKHRLISREDEWAKLELVRFAEAEKPGRSPSMTRVSPKR